MEAAMKLWELGDELEAIGAEILENGGEVTPELEARLDALSGAWESKVERVALMARANIASGLAADVECCRLEKIKRSHERAAESLKAYLFREMEKVGRPKVETPRARIRIQANGGAPVIRWVGKLEDLPETFKRVTVAVDGTAVQEAHKNSALPDGFVVEPRAKHLRIE